MSNSPSPRSPDNRIAIMRYILTFMSVHFVMKAGRLLKGEGIDVTVTPIPRKVSSECGMALEVQCEDIEKIKERLKAEDCRMVGAHEFPGD